MAISLLLAFAVPAQADLANLATGATDPAPEAPVPTEQAAAPSSTPESGSTEIATSTGDSEPVNPSDSAGAVPESIPSESSPTPVPSQAPAPEPADATVTRATAEVTGNVAAALNTAAKAIDQTSSVDDVAAAVQPKPDTSSALPLEHRVPGLLEKATGDIVETLKGTSAPVPLAQVRQLTEATAPTLDRLEFGPVAPTAGDDDLLVQAGAPAVASVGTLPSVPMSIANSPPSSGTGSPPSSEVLRGAAAVGASRPIEGTDLAGVAGTGFGWLGSWPASATSPELTLSMAIGDAVGLTVRGTPDASSPNRSGGPPPPSDPVPAPGSPALAASGPGASLFIPLAALLALLALAAPATLRRLGEVPAFSAPTPFVCALERPG